ncbi:hypothetical protein [Pleomorphovibrio marinus]|uniref:hypothetical protein n=1 Tax=Pleomorphovibrio marinus TaxID=2164132 RepID=UPI000E0AFCEC|nr:hypothetical protein [Pleomorphovibrio marinus]
MDTNRISLRSERELGAILSDGFTFLKENIKPIFRILYKTALLPFLLLLVAVGITSTYGSGGSGVILILEDGNILAGLSIVLMLVAGLAYNLLTASAIWEFMKVYGRDVHEVDEKQVVRQTFKNAAKLLGFSFLAFIILVLGFMLFVFPGIYFSVPLYVGAVAMIMENRNLSAGISRGFDLIKGQWWVTFGTILVIFIILGIISFTFQIPMYAYLMLKNLVFSEEGGGLMVAGKDVIWVVISVLTNAITYLLYIVHMVFAGLVYFDLDEQKSSTGLFDEIEKLEKANE